MKAIEEIHSCVIDAGTFIPLADMMGRRVRKSSYYSPYEQEYLGIERGCIGDGMEHFERVNEYMDPEFFDSVDLWIFPDIGYGGFQRYLRRLGKPVWGSMGASDLELYRTRFLRILEQYGLPHVPSIICRGLTELADHLKTVKDKWVKINEYRDNMETWHHVDFTHSQRELERLSTQFGPLKESPVFVVQDTIKDEDGSPVIEIGYDGWLVTADNGEPQFPPACYQGYEAKNQLYLGSLLQYEDLPEEVQFVNKKFAPALAEFGYRNFFATEIRVKDGQAYFIDPTCRMAGQTQEHLLLTCENLPEVIWEGAHGKIIRPEFSHKFAAEATLHYKSNGEGWKTFAVPPEVDDRVKLYRCCREDDAYHFPPHKSDELGVVVGQGDTIEASIEDLHRNFEQLSDLPVTIDAGGFVDLIEQIQTAEKEGVEFSDQPVPEPADALELK